METTENSPQSANMPTKIAYWFSTVIVLFLLSVAVFNYHASHDAISGYFELVGYPSYIVYPLAYLKLLTIVIIVTHRYNDLRDMAYAAYFINMVMALVAHLFQGDSYIHAAVGVVAVICSYLLGNKVRGRAKRNFFGRFTE